MKKDALKFNDDNKDKPYCKGRMFVGSGRGGAHWETCDRRDRCLKYKEWVSAGKPLCNHEEHVPVELVSVSVFRQCFLYNL